MTLVTLAAAPAFAQTSRPNESRALSLRDALTLAEQTSEAVAIARIGVTRAEGERVQARSGLFPQVFANAGYERTLRSPFRDAARSGGGNPFESVLNRLPFGQANQYWLGLSFTQTLYNRGLPAQTRAAEAGERTATIDVASARAQLALDVAEAYYDAILGDRLVNIAQFTLDEAETTLRQMIVALQVGHRPEFDVLRARVARDSDRPVLIQQRAVRDIAYVRLKQLLQLPVDQRITLITTLDDGALMPSGGEIAAATLPQTATGALDQVDNRAPVREAREAVLVQQNLLQTVQAQRYPAVVLASQFQRLAYPISLFSTPDQFLTNWTVGISTQVPIFTGGQIRGAATVARARLDEARFRLSQVLKLADLDTRDAITRWDAAEARWSASSGTVVQAARAYQIANVRFREGVSTQIELADAQLLLQQAEVNRVMAGRDLRLARLRVQLLPDLPINAGAAAPALPITPATQPQMTRPAAPGTANPAQPQPLRASGQPQNPGFSIPALVSGSSIWPPR